MPPANTAKGTDTAAVYIQGLAPGSKHVTAPQCRTLVWTRTRTRKQPHAAAAAAPAFRWTGPVSHELRSRLGWHQSLAAQIYYTKEFDITQRRHGWTEPTRHRQRAVPASHGRPGAQRRARATAPRAAGRPLTADPVCTPCITSRKLGVSRPGFLRHRSNTLMLHSSAAALSCACAFT